MGPRKGGGIFFGNVLFGGGGFGLVHVAEGRGGERGSVLAGSKPDGVWWR